MEDILSVFIAEIARQATQMKLMRKLEKHALSRAAKEALANSKVLQAYDYYSQWHSRHLA